MVAIKKTGILVQGVCHKNLLPWLSCGGRKTHCIRGGHVVVDGHGPLSII